MALTQVIGRGLGTQTTLAGSNTLVLDTDGIMTRPLQPAFLVKPTSSQDNIPINANTNIVFGTEIYDQNGDFASNTFTAPVTGRYQLNVLIYVQNLDTATDWVQCSLVTSNRTLYDIVEPDFSSDLQYFVFKLSVLIDMDASDTAYVRFELHNSGSSQMDVQTNSFFSGFLAC